MRIVRAGALAAAVAAGCSSQDRPADPFGTATSDIQGGTADTTHTFAVGVAITQTGLTLCSGALLAPNLVATARHCVAPPPAEPIDCATTMFGSLATAANVFVSDDAVLTNSSRFVKVTNVIVPTGPNQNKVCGNDIALLILAQPIQLPHYVTPIITPPMTDHSLFSTTMTAIGYGVDTPTDTTGATSGTRRIRENIDLTCIPNDKTFADCFADPTASRFISANEFEGGAGTCDGDSGSSAYEQRSFLQGQWNSFGVLSRGGVDPDGSTCIASVYTRFDAWGPLLVSAAQQAALAGGYSPPVWAGGDGGTATASASSTANSGGGVTAACLANDMPCASNAACCSNNCLSHDNGTTFMCAQCNVDNPCDVGLACVQGVCVAGQSATPLDAGGASHGGGGDKGCSVAAAGQGGGARGTWGLALAVGGAFLGRARRRTRRASRQRGRNSPPVQ